MTEARRYRLISADSHINGPGDIWTARVPQKYLDRVPRIERLDQGDAWVCQGFEPRPFGWEACAGKTPDQMGEWCTVEDTLPGGHNAKARLVEMDTDGVDAELLFPMGFASGFVSATKDAGLNNEMARAYNDFLSEFCSVALDRFVGAAMLPSQSVDQAVAEVQRCQDLPGLGSFLLKCYPHGDIVLKPEDDPLWAAIEESGKPISIHIGLTDTMPTGKVDVRALPGTGHFYDAPKRMLEWIFGGVLDRFPNLKIILAEVDCGWMPYFAEQAELEYEQKTLAEPCPVCGFHFPVAAETPNSTSVFKDLVG